MIIHSFKIHKFVLLLTIYLFPFLIHATIDWEMLTEKMYLNPDAHNLIAIGEGSSNANYRFVLDGRDYFIRFAPPTISLLGAEMEIEYQILQALSELHVTPQPVYYNKNKKIMVTEFITEAQDEVDFQDPLTRHQIISLLHQIEDLEINITRVFHPYKAVLKLTEINFKGSPFPEIFYTEVLPALKSIGELLSKERNERLCHFDLHFPNFLKNKDRLWLIDWEYATMGDSMLTPGSMASIGLWDNQEMESFLKEYIDHPTLDDFYRLFLCRIAIDAYWAAWTHIQSNISTIEYPYETWEMWFLDAAVSRIRSPTFLKAIVYLESKE